MNYKPIEFISPSIEIDSKELGITLKTSPEILREIEEIQQAKGVAVPRLRGVLFLGEIMDNPVATKAHQILDEAHASCNEQKCGANCHAKNAQAWAHQHTKKTGHSVMLQLTYFVKV